jgi:carbamoyl-phosphate synthase large subunit
MLDKLASWEFSVQAGLPFAETISTDAPAAAIEAFADTHGFPLIMKPRHGFGSRDVFFLLNAEQLRRAIGRPDFVIQRYVGDPAPICAYANAVATEGVPLFHTLEAIKPSIQSLIGPDGKVVDTFAAIAIMRLGRDERTLMELDPQAKQLGDLCAAAFSRIGWRGPLNLNCARDRDGQLRVFEFNGRFTGATAARRLLGYDEVSLALQTFCQFGGTPSAGSLDRGDTPSEVVRFPVGRVPDARNVRELLRTGYWRAAPAL